MTVCQTGEGARDFEWSDIFVQSDVNWVCANGGCCLGGVFWGLCVYNGGSFGGHGSLGVHVG